MAFWTVGGIAASIGLATTGLAALRAARYRAAVAHSEAAFLHERHLLESLMTTMPDNVYFKDVDSRFVRVNAAMAAHLGISSPAEVVGLSDHDIFADAHAQAARADEERILRSGAVLADIEERNVWPDGSEFWVSTTKAPLRDSAGNIIGTFGISRDITDRKRSDLRQRALVDGMRAVLDTTDALLLCETEDALLKAAVELSRSRLGLERCAILLTNPDGSRVRGTYGTNMHGETTDERANDYATVREDREAWMRMRDSSIRWYARERPFTEMVDGHMTEIGHGKIAATPIFSHEALLGVLYNDNAVSGAPLDETRQEIIALYCVTLGHILQRKRAEEALVRERHVLDSLLDSAPDYIYFKDREGHYTRINRALTARLGATDAAQLIGKTDFDLLPDALASRHRADEVRIMETGTPIVNREEQMDDAAGVTWLGTTLMPLRDPFGEIAGVFGISRDITTIKHAQELEHAVARHMATVFTMADELLACGSMEELQRRAVELPRERLGLERTGMFVLDADGQTMHGTFGTSPDGTTAHMRGQIHSITPRTRMALVQLEHESRRWVAFDADLSDGDSALERPSRQGQKAITPVHWLGQRNGLFFNDNGVHGTPLDPVVQDALAVYCSLLGNILQRKLAEEQLRESEARVRRITDNMLDMIVQTDAESRVVYISPSVTAVLGYQPEDLLGKTMNATMHPDDIDDAVAAADEVRHGAQSVRYQMRRLTKQGTYIWLETVAVPITDEDGQFAGTVRASRDITERIQAEEELGRSNSELQQFAYVASHDLQEPLRMIASYVQLLQRRYQGRLDSEADEFIGYAVEGANRMKALINDLLTYSRVGTHGKAFAVVAMGEVIKRAKSNLMLAIEDAGAQVTSDPLPVITGDETQLLQLMQNLIGNAIKFRREEAPAIHIASTRVGRHWEISVRDNGIGIDPQYAERIFVMFQRLHTKTEYPGTGIGLAVCKRIVERHGGRIWVEPAPTHGSDFHFILPARGGMPDGAHDDGTTG
jgi:PAS domain S-box-containing protein